MKDKKEVHQNNCGDFIMVVYNAILTILWGAFSVCFFVEWKEYGTHKLMEHPRIYLANSIMFLKVV